MRKCITLAFMICAGAAQADTTDLAVYGRWTVFGGTSDQKVPVCGISTSWNGNTAGFLIKWFQGVNGLVVHIYKSSWNIPAGIQLDVSIQFGHAAPWTVRATHVGTSKMIELTVPSDRVSAFLTEVRYSSFMTVAFPSGTEPPWVGSMEGSNNAVVAMAQCYRNTQALSSQPFANNPPQPYGNNAPQPSAPSLPPHQPLRQPPAIPADQGI
jgi:hypothetical protein